MLWHVSPGSSVSSVLLCNSEATNVVDNQLNSNPVNRTCKKYSICMRKPVGSFTTLLTSFQLSSLSDLLRLTMLANGLSLQHSSFGNTQLGTLFLISEWGTRLYIIYWINDQNPCFFEDLLPQKRKGREGKLKSKLPFYPADKEFSIWKASLMIQPQKPSKLSHRWIMVFQVSTIKGPFLQVCSLSSGFFLIACVASKSHISGQLLLNFTDTHLAIRISAHAKDNVMSTFVLSS